MTRGYPISFHVIHELALKSDEETAMTAPLICDGSRQGFLTVVERTPINNQPPGGPNDFPKCIYMYICIYIYIYMYIYICMYVCIYVCI